MQHYYQEKGFQVAKDGDHIGHELSFLAFICDVEDQNQRQVRNDSINTGLNKFLRDHLLTWLPAFSLALEHCDNDFYGELGRLTMAIIDDHLMDLTDLIDEAAIDLEGLLRKNQMKMTWVLKRLSIT